MMSDNEGRFNIQEQVIEDLVSELTLQFIGLPNGRSKLVIFGDNLQYGNRDLTFDSDGWHDGAGTFVGTGCKPKPTFIRESKVVEPPDAAE